MHASARLFHDRVVFLPTHLHTADTLSLSDGSTGATTLDRNLQQIIPTQILGNV